MAKVAAKWFAGRSQEMANPAPCRRSFLLTSGEHLVGNTAFWKYARKWAWLQCHETGTYALLGIEAECLSVPLNISRLDGTSSAVLSAYRVKETSTDTKLIKKKGRAIPWTKTLTSQNGTHTCMHTKQRMLWKQAQPLKIPKPKLGTLFRLFFFKLRSYCASVYVHKERERRKSKQRLKKKKSWRSTFESAIVHCTNECFDYIHAAAI